MDLTPTARGQRTAVCVLPLDHQQHPDGLADRGDGSPGGGLHTDDAGMEATAWITRAGQVEQQSTGRQLAARQSFIIGRLQRQQDGSWEADEELGKYLRGIWENPQTRWEDLEAARSAIEARVNRQ